MTQDRLDVGHGLDSRGERASVAVGGGRDAGGTVGDGLRRCGSQTRHLLTFTRPMSS